MPDEPRLIEIGASVSTGGKVQVKKYELSSDYHFNLSAKWEIPESFTNEEAETFRHEQFLRLKQELEPLAQAELDDLMQQKEDMY